jgi:predicted CoA-binding protein
MMMEMNDLEIKSILEKSKTIAIVGASQKPERDSHMIMQFLMRHGYEVIPVNPAFAEIAGKKCYPSLRKIPVHVDIVDIFRKSEDVKPIVDDAIAIKADTIWMQLGVVNEEAAKTASDAGLKVIMNRCIKIEYNMLISS